MVYNHNSEILLSPKIGTETVDQIEPTKLFHLI